MRRQLFVLMFSCAVVLTGANAFAQCQFTLGEWLDNFNFVWGLDQENDYVLGDVEIEPNGPGPAWPVEGGSNENGFNLTATCPAAKEPRCGGVFCASFEYVGTFNVGCNSASGSWTNPCGLSGTFTMTRRREVPESKGEVPEVNPTSIGR